MDINNQIQKIRIIGKGHIKDSNKWREFADEIDILLNMVDSQKSSESCAHCLGSKIHSESIMTAHLSPRPCRYCSTE